MAADLLIMDSPLGGIRLTAVDGQLVSIRLPRQSPVRTPVPYCAESGRGPARDGYGESGSGRSQVRMVGPGTNAVLARTADWLARYFAGRRPDPRSLAVPRATQGTPFQRQVWSLVAAIPYGQTTTYGQLAARIARLRGREAMSAQAVGTAVGRNPLPILVPCHRVVGAGRGFGGYTGRLADKAWLLGHEGVDIADRLLANGVSARSLLG